MDVFKENREGKNAEIVVSVIGFFSNRVVNDKKRFFLIIRLCFQVNNIFDVEIASRKSHMDHDG